MTTTPAEPEGCSGGDDLSRSKMQNHRKRYQQRGSALPTKLSTECKQNANGDTRRVKRNHSLTTSTVSSSLPALIESQKSPRIGIVPRHHLPGGATLNEIESVAETLAAQPHALWDTDVSPPRSGRGIRRAGAVFTYGGKVWMWNLVERRAPMGVTLEVFGPCNQSPLPLIVRKAWRGHHAAA